MVNSRIEKLYHGDCLFVLRHDIQPDSVDLIYLDPPFFTGTVRKGTGQPGEMEISFDDSRRFWAEHQEEMRNAAPVWMQHLALERPDFASYLWYMMARLQECHSVLKSTGSIYLHCDPRVSHYLKMVMDEIFGWRNFLNEIIWSYRSGGGSKLHFGRKHDVIFWYTRTKVGYTFNADAVRVPYSAIIAESRRGLFNEKGKVVGSVWDISRPPNHSKEWLGYPTQKPEVLLERIIAASSNPGDVVLDPFCGSGTTLAIAKNLGRQWIGIDSYDEAIKIAEKRIGCLRVSETYDF